MKRILLALIGLLVLCVGGGFAYLAWRSPHTAPPRDIKVEATPERLERGKYLFDALADCTGCHSERDWTKFGGPVIENRVGVGFRFPKELGLPGDVSSRNITPDKETGLGNWTDGEKIRAIREGVSKDGHALFSFMPYKSLRYMSDEDVHALVAYMNSLPAVRHEVLPTKLDFPVNYLIKGAPEPVNAAIPPPDRSNSVRYGEYLVRMGGCPACHTQQEKGELKQELLLAGGFEFHFSGKTVVSANITPEVETGIGGWSEEKFVTKFKGYANMTAENAPLATQANFTLMPWLHLSHLAEQDLKAIYAFLRTVPPVKNLVDPHKPLTEP